MSTKNEILNLQEIAQEIATEAKTQFKNDFMKKYFNIVILIIVFLIFLNLFSVTYFYFTSLIQSNINKSNCGINMLEAETFRHIFFQNNTKDNVRNIYFMIIIIFSLYIFYSFINSYMQNDSLYDPDYNDEDLKKFSKMNMLNIILLLSLLGILGWVSNDYIKKFRIFDEIAINKKIFKNSNVNYTKLFHTFFAFIVILIAIAVYKLLINKDTDNIKFNSIFNVVLISIFLMICFITILFSNLRINSLSYKKNNEDGFFKIIIGKDFADAEYPSLSSIYRYLYIFVFCLIAFVSYPIIMLCILLGFKIKINNTIIRNIAIFYILLFIINLFLVYFVNKDKLKSELEYFHLYNFATKNKFDNIDNNIFNFLSTINFGYVFLLLIFFCILSFIFTKNLKDLNLTDIIKIIIIFIIASYLTGIAYSIYQFNYPIQETSLEYKNILFDINHNVSLLCNDVENKQHNINNDNILIFEIYDDFSKVESIYNNLAAEGEDEDKKIKFIQNKFRELKPNYDSANSYDQLQYEKYVIKVLEYIKKLKHDLDASNKFKLTVTPPTEINLLDFHKIIIDNIDNPYITYYNLNGTNTIKDCDTDCITTIENVPKPITTIDLYLDNYYQYRITTGTIEISYVDDTKFLHYIYKKLIIDINKDLEFFKDENFIKIECISDVILYDELLLTITDSRIEWDDTINNTIDTNLLNIQYDNIIIEKVKKNYQYVTGKPGEIKKYVTNNNIIYWYKIINLTAENKNLYLKINKTSTEFSLFKSNDAGDAGELNLGPVSGDFDIYIYSKTGQSDNKIRIYHKLDGYRELQELSKNKINELFTQVNEKPYFSMKSDVLHSMQKYFNLHNNTINKDNLNVFNNYHIIITDNAIYTNNFDIFTAIQDPFRFDIFDIKTSSESDMYKKQNSFYCINDVSIFKSSTISDSSENELLAMPAKRYICSYLDFGANENQVMNKDRFKKYLELNNTEDDVIINTIKEKYDLIYPTLHNKIPKSKFYILLIILIILAITIFVYIFSIIKKYVTGNIYTPQMYVLGILGVFLVVFIFGEVIFSRIK